MVTVTAVRNCSNVSVSALEKAAYHLWLLCAMTANFSKAETYEQPLIWRNAPWFPVIPLNFEEHETDKD